MNDNDGGLKRSQEPVETASTVEHKKQKIHSNQQTQKQAHLLPTTLDLDKVQEESINDVGINSNAGAPLLQGNTGTTNKAEDSAGTKDSNDTVATEMPSANSTETVTATLPGNEKIEEVASSITSEQLLFALTSVPSSEKAAEERQEKLTKENTDTNQFKPSIDNSTVTSKVPPEPRSKVVAPSSTLSSPKNTTVPAASAISEPAVPESVITSIPTTATTTSISPSVLQDAPPTNVVNSSIPTASQKANISSSNNTSSINSPSLSTSTATSASSLAFSSLPDISAALRRLSSTNPSVIEQLSSSPRLSSHFNDRRGSSIDVSPSEILGNALAAVAANAAAARSSSNNLVASPNQQQQNAASSAAPTTISNSSTNNVSNSSNMQTTATATAAAIGNLAAFTANISSLLNSGGFHRNSFSQEDTQKLAAAVAVARNPQQRRKSSMQLMGNAFSNMIDQAILMGRNKSFSEAANRPAPPTSNNSSSPTILPPASSTTAEPVVPKPKLIVKNEQVWKSVEGMEEKSLGFQLYSHQLLLPNLESSVNGLMEIRVPARFLTFDNLKVKRKALWGTDIYTDDSDIVAMAIHSGKYQPHFVEPAIQATDPFALAVAGRQKESIEAARKLALSDKKYTQHNQHSIPDHDLKVTVRVLPALQYYSSSIRHKIKSREWGKHDGMSLFVNKVEIIKRGEARLKGRSSLKSNMFAYEPYRKQALGSHYDKKPCPTSTDTSPPPIQKGRIKKSKRVMRMFQIRSELKNNNNK
ncbi:hypothetical protein [Parasitella parasitica]|uniref:Uncharacterized protein n=1 Tax=Parasitella parasitica TaxID=35722 RepID=A0A0B7NLS7_9FUNG|nr:hypothetical protein [Parasitella parasitica]